MAELTDERLKELLAYCRIPDPTDEDMAVIRAAYSAAVVYMAGAGVDEPAADAELRPLYDLCVNYRVLDAYDHRDAKEPASESAENPAYRQAMNQLKQAAGLARGAGVI